MALDVLRTAPRAREGELLVEEGELLEERGPVALVGLGLRVHVAAQDLHGPGVAFTQLTWARASGRDGAAGRRSRLAPPPPLEGPRRPLPVGVPMPIDAALLHHVDLRRVPVDCLDLAPRVAVDGRPRVELPYLARNEPARPARGIR